MSQTRIKGKFLMTPPEAMKALSPPQYMVYSALSYRADNATGECYPSWARIMDDTGMSRTPVYQHIEALVALGWITKISRGSAHSNRANSYKVHEHPIKHSTEIGTKHSTEIGTKHGSDSSTPTRPITKPITRPNLETPIGVKDLVNDIDFDVVIDNGDSEPSDHKANPANLDYDF